MAFTEGADATCPVCGSTECRGFPTIPLPPDYPFLREDQMADHPKTDEPDDPKAQPKPRRGRARRLRADRAVRGPREDREKRTDEDR